MKCPSCKRSNVQLKEIVRANRWKPAWCPDCGAAMVARPIVHVLIALVVPAGLIAPFWVAGTFGMKTALLLGALGVVTAVLASIGAMWLLPPATVGGRGIPIEEALVVAGVIMLVLFEIAQ